MEPRIIRRAIPQRFVENALRTINMRLYEQGMRREQARVWAERSCWFPDLCSPEHPALTELWIRATQALRPPEHQGHWTQIILQFPVVDPPPVEWHVDNPPSDGRRFIYGIGVPLTQASPWNGGLQFPRHESIYMYPGDVIGFDPNAEHTGGWNQSGALRYVVYFRLLD